MKPEEVLIEIKSEFADEKNNVSDNNIDNIVVNIFLNNMGYKGIDEKNTLNGRL